MPDLIHKTAIIHPKAQVDSSAVVGPYAVIDENVTVGAGCRIGPNVYLTGNTNIGANNVFHAGAVIGDAPQDLKYKGEPTRLRIGDNNVFREHVTVHRSNKMAEDTVIGAGNFFMAASHVGHNCIIGDNNILANCALLGGHVIVADRVFISGTCMVHQFVRIGTLSLMQGGSGISKDLPPFTIARGNNGICGLNVIGLRRAGYTTAQRLELKKVYHAVFRSGKNLRQAAADATAQFDSEPARLMLDFINQSKRGVCHDTSQRIEGEDEE
jgi:UDP-N-acetylglucosamine acyltransferase